jgi:ABC-type multidrug transport system fused ATPase/permease subunit
VIIVSHRPGTIGDVDTVVVMDHGRTVEVGDPKLLREEASLFRTMWEKWYG